jgi:hypothetical protein
MKKLLAFSIFIVLLFPACAKKPADTSQAPPATPLEQSLLSLKDNIGKKDYDQAWLSLRSSLEAFWGETPLLLNNTKFVTSENNTFGIYTPKDSEEFAPGEVVRLYCEPVGYSVNKNAQGQYEFAFRADFSIADEKGKVLGGQKDFANLNFTSWNFNTEVALTFTFTFTGLEKGKYKIITLVKDANSEKTATVEKTISII